jgi:hypothetical protein
MFSEAMYYIFSEGTSDDDDLVLHPLKMADFQEGLISSLDGISYISFSQSEGSIKTIVIGFEEAYNGSTIGYDNPLTDASTNIAGLLNLTFRNSITYSDGSVGPGWVAEFSKEQ